MLSSSTNSSERASAALVANCFNRKLQVYLGLRHVGSPEIDEVSPLLTPVFLANSMEIAVTFYRISKLVSRSSKVERLLQPLTLLRWVRVIMTAKKHEINKAKCASGFRVSLI